MDHTLRGPNLWKRRLGLAIWASALVTGVGLFLFRHEWLKDQLRALSGASPFWLGALYLALGCVRGFTLVPATYLLVAGMLVLAPVPLFVLTLAGIVVSSTAVYFFAERFGLAAFFERHHAPQVARLRNLMQRRELPIVVIWSFLPIAPTDLVCYVCGALKVDLKTCVLGVVAGEGAICAIYIFIGGRALEWFF
jgi:uncharacterized membrane protein YdjX (TVP38/TMEM64 family)